MADLAEMIRCIPLFSGLSREDIAKIMGNLVEVEFATGSTIFSEGDKGDALYLIQSGVVHVVVDVAEGKSETIAVLGPQDYFGEMALLSSSPRSASVVAVKDNALWKLSRESWDELIAKHSSWLLHFCSVLSQRLSQMDRQYSQGRDAFNALAEEFYSKRSADEQEFYRHAALLTTLDLKSIGRLLQVEAAENYLLDLEKSQLPLIQRVDGGYELHSFFREYLAGKLLDVEGAAKKLQLHSQFASLFEKQSNWGQAIHHSVEAKDWSAASRILLAHKDDLLDNFPGLIENLRARMPRDVFYGNLPLVQLYADTLCRSGDVAGAARCFQDALAERESSLGAAMVARYSETAEDLIEQQDCAQALNYLRNVLDIAVQHVSAQTTVSEGNVRRLDRKLDRGSVNEINPTASRWFSWLSRVSRKVDLTRWFGGVAGLGVWAYLWFATPDIGLTPAATKQLGILLLTFIYWVFWVFPDYGVALIFSLGFILPGLAKPEVVLGGFASTTWFTTLGVLGLGAAITITGLFYRFSLQMVRYFPVKYNWQIFALGIMGIVVMALIPQQSARTAIISQMLINLSESLGYKNPSKASTGLFVASFLGLGQLGFLFLTGSTTSLIAWGLLPAEVRAQFTWGYWFLAALPPTLIVSVIIVGATMLLFQPESQAQISYKMVQTQLQILGPLSRSEWVTLAVLCFTVAGWLTVSWHRVDGAWIALLALCVLINFGVLGWGMLKKGVDWEMLVYMGATLSIPALLTDAKIDHWLVGLFSPLILPFTAHPSVAFVIIALITYLVKLVFTSFLTVVTLCIALLPLASALHISPWIMIMIILIASEVWFFPFQVDWHTMAFATTNGKGFSYRLMNRISPFYALAYLIALIASIPYWRLLGLMK